MYLVPKFCWKRISNHLGSRNGLLQGWPTSKRPPFLDRMACHYNQQQQQQQQNYPTQNILFLSLYFHFAVHFPCHTQMRSNSEFSTTCSRLSPQKSSFFQIWPVVIWFDKALRICQVSACDWTFGSDANTASGGWQCPQHSWQLFMLLDF